MKAANRTGDKDIILCMRKSLSAKYGDKLLGVGGVMLLEKGKAKIHVMVLCYGIMLWYYVMVLCYGIMFVAFLRIT